MGVSCCGQAKDDPGVVMNSQRFPGAGPGIIDSQPTYQPVPNHNINGFQPPTIPSPPTVPSPSITPHDYNPFSNHGLQPPMRAMSPSQQSAGHAFSGSTYNGQPPFLQPNFTGSTFNNAQPLMREFGASSPPQQHAATFTGTTYNGSNFNSVNHSLTRPKSSHSPHSPPPQVNATVQDEGKMSVSIDFGVCSHVTSLHSLIPVQVQPSLVL